ncbi:MAG: primosomal protein [Caulobacter sp.]|nr:primosomal protein [Caulobacter sp.]
MTPQADFETEAQDRAEILDETNLTEDGDRIANFDEIPDVFDATSAEGDADDEAFDNDDAEAIDEDLDVARDDEGLDIGREPLSAAGSEPGGVPTDADKPSDLEADEEETDVDADPHVDRQLDKGLKETFPASDPVSINPGAD